MLLNDKEKDMYRAITEQGDLGLGAEVLGAADQKVLKEAATKDSKEKTLIDAREVFKPLR